MNGVSLITCTGRRSESLARCAKYVARFDNPDGLPVQWIVVDDVSPSLITDCFARERYDLLNVRAAHRWRPGMNSLALNLLEAIPYVKHDAVMFIEDDDAYRSDYMVRQLGRLADHEMAGESVSRYYHVPTSRWRVMENVNYASLCQTAMRSSMLPALRQACNTDQKFIDWRLWHTPPTSPRTLDAGEPRVVGMKGLPGRPGIGIGHRPDLGAGWNADPGREKLREWLGDDADLYVGPKQASEHANNHAQSAHNASATAI